MLYLLLTVCLSWLQNMSSIVHKTLKASLISCQMPGKYATSTTASSQANTTPPTAVGVTHGRVRLTRLQGSMQMGFSNMQHFLLRAVINQPINSSSMSGIIFPERPASAIIRPPPPPIPASPTSTCLSVSGESCARVPCTACWRGRAPAAPPPCSRSQCTTARRARWSSTWCR